jgi:adenylate cyclase class IV
MSQHEIETKWDARQINRSAFNRFVWSVIDSVPHEKWSFQTTGGPDHYFANPLGYVARHRDGQDLKELTVKARLDQSDITVRIEHNIPLDLKLAKAQVVHAFLRTSGYQKQVTITKDCDIYKFKMKRSPVEVVVVWYEVFCEGHPKRAFIEVEVDGGSNKQRLKMLAYWTRLLESKLKLKKTMVIKDSLYELYTSNKYRMAT